MVFAVRWLYKKASQSSRDGETATKDTSSLQHQSVQQTAPVSDIETNGLEQATKVTEKPSDLPQVAPQSAQNASVQQDEAEKRQRRIYRIKLVAALFPCQFLGAVDATIVSTALTTIASHFNQLEQFNWIVTAYTLCSTAFIPAFGQIADIFGRHVALQISMLCMLIGSTMCAAAQTWGMLLFGRALQGISSAGINNIVKIVLADKVTLAEQSKNTTVFSLVAGISFAVGPVIGGSLAVSNWRYCFVISIPISLLASVLVFLLLRKELIHGTNHLTGPESKSLLSGLSTIDFGGTVFFIFGTGLIILATSWGGAKYSWNSYQVLVPLVIGSILFILFFIYEYFLEPGKQMSRIFPKQVAMIPWSLFDRRDVISLAVINAATGASLYSAIYFVGLFWTLAENYSPQQAGYQLLYYTPGIGVGVYSAMFLCNIFPRQTFYPLFFGSIVEAAGFSVLAYATSKRNHVLVSIMLAIAGGGSGVRFMPNTLHGAGIWRERIAAVMSLMDFALPFGGTLAIAIMSSVFYNKFTTSLGALSDQVGASNITSHSTQSLQGIDALPPAAQDFVRQKAAHAVMWSFISVIPIMGLSVTAAMMLGNVWIKPKKSIDGKRSKGAVLYSSYLLALITGTLKAKKQSLDDDEDKPQATELTSTEKVPAS